MRAEGPVEDLGRILGLVDAQREQTENFDIVFEDLARFIAMIADNLLGAAEHVILNGAQNVLDLPALGIFLGDEKGGLFVLAHISSLRAVGYLPVRVLVAGLRSR